MDIKKSLDEYLEFDSRLLFDKAPINEFGFKLKRLTRIFGGAIRDIIAGQTINDIDILVGAQSCKSIELALKENGYAYMESLGPKGLSSVYSDIAIINEPRTWMKGTKIVQVIRPVVNSGKESDSQRSNLYEAGFVDLIQNVDISCCGVSWDGETLYENYPNAISHCQNKVFFANKSAKMYSYKRTTQREFKFIERGWAKIENTAVAQRDQRIDAILGKMPAIEYTSELPNSVSLSGDCFSVCG